jgi:hypothetical protein
VLLFARWLVLTASLLPVAFAQSSSDFPDKLLDLLGPAEPSVLTPEQRFQAFMLNTAGPVPLIGEGLGAGILQRADSPYEWGQGWNGYLKRYASELAFNGVRQSISYTVASAFHEDYRYFASTDQGAWRRIRHALVSTFTARNPDGTNGFSVASVASVVGASGIASLWSPRSWQGMGYIAQNAGLTFAQTAGFNVIREFLPNILGRPRK